MRHIVLFALHTGARRQEVLNLKWTDIQGSFVNFRETKTSKARMVPLNDEVQNMLDRMRGSSTENVVNLKGEKVKAKPSEYVFPYQGRKVAFVRKSFQKACDDTGLVYGMKNDGGVTFHTLRHTFGSWLAIKGVPIKTIQELMGHENITMTMSYAHLAESVKVDAVNILNGLTEKKNENSMSENVRFSESDAEGELVSV